MRAVVARAPAPEVRRCSGVGGGGEGGGGEGGGGKDRWRRERFASFQNEPSQPAVRRPEDKGK